MGSFLTKIQNTYVTEVEYHNDLHGADVMQMSYYYLTTCKLRQILKLNKLDCLSFLMAAVCHDLGHDGFTNSYHVNAITSRAVNCNDVSVQESYHASQMFKLIGNDTYNFAKNLSKEEFKIFRQRAIGIILATDMANHASEISAVAGLFTSNDIKNGENMDKLIGEGVDEKEMFKNQQKMMEMTVHACDLSTPTRSFEIVHEWTYLLFHEFFKQGDKEKLENLPVTFLCDRETVNVAKVQGGFYNFVVLTLYAQLVHLMPMAKVCTDQIKTNVQTWGSYEETEQDKKVYEKPGADVVIEEEKEEDGSD